jgi:hypothetical protein
MELFVARIANFAVSVENGKRVEQPESIQEERIGWNRVQLTPQSFGHGSFSTQARILES